MATARSLINAALQRINTYQSGDPVAAPDLSDCLETLNDFLDYCSQNHLLVVGSNENVFNFSAGLTQYRIGNPTNDSLGEPPFIGTLTGGSAIITGVTNVPSDLEPGATLSALSEQLPENTVVTGISVPSQMITMSQPAIMTPANNPDQISYTIPGDWAMPRPLRITNGFTRINGLDFTCEVTMSQDRFLEILYKAQPGPWPTVAWYNPQMPYGLLNFYPAPGSSAEFHLWSDGLLSNLTLNQTFNLPQGYSMFLKWNLAEQICAMFGREPPATVKEWAKKSMDAVKALNEQPAVVSRYDRELTQGNRPDGGWITRGGYR